MKRVRATAKVNISKSPTCVKQPSSSWRSASTALATNKNESGDILFALSIRENGVRSKSAAVAPNIQEHRER